MSVIYEITQMLRNGNFPTVKQHFKKVVHVGHSFGSIETYLLTTLYPTASDGIILTGWSTDSSFLGQTLAAWNVHLAR